MIAILLLVCQLPPAPGWKIPPGAPVATVERVADVQAPEVPVPQKTALPRAVLVTMPGCPPCSTMKNQILVNWPKRTDIRYEIVDYKIWNAANPNNTTNSFPTLFLWPVQGKAGYRKTGIVSEAQANGLLFPAKKQTVSTETQQSDHLARMKAKYGWIPSSHCGRRGCSMCNEIFGASRASGRRQINVFGSTTPVFQTKYEDFNPTPMVVIEEAIKLANLDSSDTLVDLGCGDGRILAAGFRQGAGRGIGVERNAKTAMLAHENNLLHDCDIIVGDITSGLVDLAGKKVFVYLYPQALASIPGLDRAEMVISFCHKPPQLPNAREVPLYIDKGEPFTMFVWSKDV